MEKPISLSQIGVYNPQRQSDELTERLFILRINEFNSLMDSLNEETPDSIPQHHLIIAQRGMGKTTLLTRIAVELHKENYRKKFIPLQFPEEQYNLKDLTKFWLNCLEALTNSLDAENYDEKKIDKINAHTQQLVQEYGNDDINDKLYRHLMDCCAILSRRPVLLIDNIGLVFNRLSKQEQYVLRGYISEKACPIIISAGVTMAGYSNTKDAVFDYKAPFYDFFQIHYLKKINIDELKELLYRLSEVTKTEITIGGKEEARLKSLLQLTGGNPRTSVMLFRLLIKGFSSDIANDLEALLDEITPLYKSRFEELPTQQQIILDAIAQNWDAMSLKKISEETRLENNQLSPQLKRLIKEGWLETTKAYDSKGNAYFISERFLAVWLLMRAGNRRKWEAIICLTAFVERMYAERQLQDDSHYFEPTLFALSKHNVGDAKENLLKVLNLLGSSNHLLSTTVTLSNFSAQIINLNYTQWFLDIMKEIDFDIILSPYYVAIKAIDIERNNNAEISEIYLKNQAIEKTEPARIIIETIKTYLIP